MFQVPGRAEGGPEEPPDYDTFEIRFYEPDQLVSELTEIGFAFVDLKHHTVESPQLTFDQLRLRFSKPQ